jgi:para-nitrobenzyl esterase
VTRPRADAERAGTTMAATLGCDDPGTAATCLRAKPAPAVLEASAGGQGFGPVIGGGVLPLDPRQALATGQFSKVPVMHGTTRDEHRMFVAGLEFFSQLTVTDDEYVADVQAYFGKDKAAKVLARYPLSDYDSASIALSSVWTDYSWAMTALDTDRLLARHVPTYAYEFADRAAPWAASMPMPSFLPGAFHASELQYLFEDSQFPGPRTDEQRRLSDQMIGYWSRFAHTGDPNGHGAPAWARFTPNGTLVQALAPGRDGTAPTDLAREHRYDFWHSLAG